MAMADDVPVSLSVSQSLFVMPLHSHACTKSVVLP